jgi:lactoylglutathione lyase
LSFSGVETDEPELIAWMPAITVYFRDTDGHLLELLAMLEDDPRPECVSCPCQSGPRVPFKVRQL